MAGEDPGTAWKAQLRYGKFRTPFKHFTVIAEGTVGILIDRFSCRPGRAFMGIKTWAATTDESAHLARVIGARIGFEVNGTVEVFETEPSQPPGELPGGYDIGFTPFDD